MRGRPPSFKVGRSTQGRHGHVFQSRARDSYPALPAPSLVPALGAPGRGLVHIGEDPYALGRQRSLGRLGAVQSCSPGATTVTQWVWPSSTLSHNPSATRHTRSVLSKDPDTMRPFPRLATAITQWVWPSSTLSHTPSDT
eukprot:CAMPEP_0182855302 /NCGR_PEP_ID=MMETSP0034_2-20130328/1760_1 /TAXON_ID=156128 /ORGANISM="Nephroselmis pyriformis, Strain CCMP717" /LENGTH=139 /DNA_ID=CAMNT_0024986241 /DNA_START=257 /DNA_END=673 /DNA_ORIENTATION=-